ncbi:MAG: HAD-IB family phosphatase [Planctomycetota bacterium]
MGAVIFDFDSTLLPGESVQELLQSLVADDPAAKARIAQLVDDGMNGRISFRESMEQRLALAQPTREQLTAFGRHLATRIPDDARLLVAALRSRGHQVWIVSGAFLDLLRPAGESLGIAHDRICGVDARWTDDDRFEGLDAGNGFADAKTDGARRLPHPWSRPAVGVGDGMTDHALFSSGFVDHFIAFTAYARREAVLATGCPEAASMTDLAHHLERLLP